MRIAKFCNVAAGRAQYQRPFLTIASQLIFRRPMSTDLLFFEVPVTVLKLLKNQGLDFVHKIVKNVKR